MLHLGWLLGLHGLVLLLWDLLRCSIDSHLLDLLLLVLRLNLGDIFPLHGRLRLDLSLRSFLVHLSLFFVCLWLHLGWLGVRLDGLLLAGHILALNVGLVGVYWLWARTLWVFIGLLLHHLILECFFH